MKLMADNYEDDHLKAAHDHTNHKPSPDQVIYLTRISFDNISVAEKIFSEASVQKVGLVDAM